ncbi:MAG TPA: LysM domain-containing protein [Acidimicrobiales bacterium]|nr:LysM domain-containing protein [Acidimicrobiales bacterium]
MVAVAHASPAEMQRLVVVRTRPTAAPAPARARRPAAAVYRRRQAVAVVLAVSVVATLVLAVGGLLASFGGGPLTASQRPGAPAAVYVVQPGDTFWEIARRLDPTGDPRPLVARLVAAHGSPVLVPGQRLALPAA